MAEQGVSVTCEGGLDLVGTTHTLFRTPGVATTLENYESSIHGGYRRINGFAKYGTNTPDTTSSNIEGIHSYAKGVVACQGSNIYYSPNGTTWTQVNKDTYITKTGTVSVSAGSATVTGSGTSFTGQFAVGDDIKINNEIFNVLSFKIIKIPLFRKANSLILFCKILKLNFVSENISFEEFLTQYYFLNISRQSRIIGRWINLNKKNKNNDYLKYLNVTLKRLKKSLYYLQNHKLSKLYSKVLVE